MFEENEYMNITNDGGVKKKIISEGYGEKPILGNRITIKYIEKNIKNELLQKKETIAVLKIGSNRINEGLDIGIQTMKVGEKSIFILSPEYSNIKLYNRPKNNKIIYEIELLKSENHQKNYSYSERNDNKRKNNIQKLKRIIIKI